MVYVRNCTSESAMAGGDLVVTATYQIVGDQTVVEGSTKVDVYWGDVTYSSPAVNYTPEYTEGIDVLRRVRIPAAALATAPSSVNVRATVQPVGQPPEAMEVLPCGTVSTSPEATISTDLRPVLVGLAAIGVLGYVAVRRP